MKNKISEKSITALTNRAAKKTLWELCEEEDSIVDDWAGGNIDDAYELGVKDGQIIMARKILKALHE